MSISDIKPDTSTHQKAPSRCLSYFQVEYSGSVIYSAIPVILQVACALALLLGPSLGLAPSGPAQALFKTAGAFCPATRII
ncbi:hypothetical protein FDX05_21855 [Citrobacter sp. wls715]|nr:hypothetical protein FDX05_21855 [Citrobacter sp. wls715]